MEPDRHPGPSPDAPSGPPAISHLEAEVAELARVNRGLEQRIKERTRALKRMAAELEARSWELEMANRQLRAHGPTDGLTGLWNRRHMETTLPQQFQRRQADQRDREGATPDDADAQLVVVLLDLDHVQQVNVEHGHQAGDAVVRQVADLLRTLMRSTDTVARWGGAQFLLVLRETDWTQVGAAVERMRRAVAEHPILLPGGATIHVTCSLGFVPVLRARAGLALPWERAMVLADTCLQAAKRAGRNAWVGVRPAPNSPISDEQPIPADAIPWLIGEGALELETSVAARDTLVWSAAERPA